MLISSILMIKFHSNIKNEDIICQTRNNIIRDGILIMILWEDSVILHAQLVHLSNIFFNF